MVAYQCGTGNRQGDLGKQLGAFKMSRQWRFGEPNRNINLIAVKISNRFSGDGTQLNIRNGGY
ncbi:hypothetical protein GCM10027424_06400 [Psychrobacter pacificensis]